MNQRRGPRHDTEDPPDAPPREVMSGRLPRRGDRIRIAVETLDDEGTGMGWMEASLTGIKEPVRAPVIVRDALPGDVVVARVTGRQQGVSSAVIESVIERSPHRVAPACIHAEPRWDTGLPVGVSCGGCTIQGLAYPQQLLHKQQRVAQHMREAGRIEVEVAPAIGAELRFGHRHKMEYSFGAGPDGALVLGLHPRGYRWEVIDLTMCQVMSDNAFAMQRAVLAEARALGLAHRDERTASGWLETLTVRERRGPTTADRTSLPAMVVELGTADVDTVATAGGPTAQTAVAERLGAAAVACRSDMSFVWTRRRVARGTPTTRITAVLAGDGRLGDSLALPDGRALAVDISPRAFFQPHPRQAEHIIARIVATLEREQRNLGRGLRVADLYCGTGILGLAAAPFVASVIGVELVPEAVADAEHNAHLNGITNAAFIAGDVGKVLGHPSFVDHFRAIDALLLDPPRAGLMPQAVGHLATLAAPLIVYVSCNPAALARDIGALATLGYAVDGPLQPIDLFPHTHHIETVAVFRRKDIAR
jgi:23S rRNA (uracil1939-C5)-methyltransferase